MNALLSLRAWLARTPLAILESELPLLDEMVRREDPDLVLEHFGVTDPHRGLLSEPPQAAVDAYYEEREVAAGPRRSTGALAVVPVYGPIGHRDTALGMLFGGTSTARLTQLLTRLRADDSVGAIMFNVDSPGGTGGGLPELAALIREIRQEKPVTALINTTGASAAYWIASQASTIVATPEAMTGSVGVFVQHTDCSGYMEQAGIKTTFVHAGRYKVEGNSNEPLSEEARDHIQAIVDDLYEGFVKDVARGRDTTSARVKADYGEGRVLTSKVAKEAGVIDRIATYGDTIARLSAAAAPRRAASLEGMTASEVVTLANLDTEAGMTVAPVSRETSEPVDSGDASVYIKPMSTAEVDDLARLLVQSAGALRETSEPVDSGEPSVTMEESTEDTNTEALDDELMFASRRYPRNARGSDDTEPVAATASDDADGAGPVAEPTTED